MPPRRAWPEAGQGSVAARPPGVRWSAADLARMKAAATYAEPRRPANQPLYPRSLLASPSRDQRAATLLITVLSYLEDEIAPVAGQFPGEQPLALDTADLGHGALRAPVFIAHPEDHGIDEGKGVVEHQSLDLAIGAAAPVAAGEKRPADLDLAQFGFIAIVPARADDASARPVDERKAH